MPVPLTDFFVAASPAADALLQGPAHPAAVAGMLCAALLYLVILVAHILILVRAFRTSVGWGLVSLFVPFGIFAFVATHWQETMKPFLVQIFCLLILGGVVAVAVVNGAQRAQARANASTPQPAPHEVRDLAESETPAPASSKPTLDPYAAQRTAYAKHAKELTTLYQQLNAERGKLKPGSPAVGAFNAKAAKYQQGITALAAEKAKLDALDSATNRNADAADALASLQASAAAGDCEAFAATLHKACDQYRQTPSFPAIAALARTTLAQATGDKVAAGLKDKAAKTARADFDKTTHQIQGIVNQVPPVVASVPAGAETYHYGYHPGASKPDFNTENLQGTRELWKGQYVNMDEAPGVFYRSADCEFNPQTKYFYTSRNVPKKRLSDGEYKELTRLYHLLGQQEKALADAAPPAGQAERVAADLATLKAQLDGYAMK